LLKTHCQTVNFLNTTIKTLCQVKNLYNKILSTDFIHQLIS